MAQKVNIIVTDDLDGSEGASTYSFGLDSGSYEIDLTEKNRKKLEEALEPFLEAARRIPRKGRSTTASSKSRGDATEIRTWAAANGHDLPSRGRIPKDVRAAYESAVQ